MDRLVTALDDLVARGTVGDEVVITAAAYGYRPIHAQGLGIQAYDALVSMMDDASAVVTHGGPASIAMALAAGHVPVVVPRNPSFGEHVDDHQMRFAAWFAKRRDIEVVIEMEHLGEALERTIGRRAQGARALAEPTEAIQRLRSILNARR
jgi:UDP-N-acetylglucosamine transferase subunit ALG13